MTSWRWPCSACTAASASSAAIRSSGVSPMPTRMPLVNGIFSSPAVRIGSRRSAGSLVREPWWATRSARVDSSMRPCEAVTPRSRVRSARPSARSFVCGSSPRSRARSQDQITYATKSSNPSARRRSPTPGTLSGTSPVRTSSSLTPRRAALSTSRSTSSGSCRCGRWVANAQYLQCDTHERESESVTLREKVTRRRIRGSLCTRVRPPAAARDRRCRSRRSALRCWRGRGPPPRPRRPARRARPHRGRMRRRRGRRPGREPDARARRPAERRRRRPLPRPPARLRRRRGPRRARPQAGLPGRRGPPAARRPRPTRAARHPRPRACPRRRPRPRRRDGTRPAPARRGPRRAGRAPPARPRRPPGRDARRARRPRDPRHDRPPRRRRPRHGAARPPRTDPAAAVASGRVAAATGRWNTDGIRLLGRRPKAHAFRADDYGAPAYPEIVLCVTRATLQDDRNVVRAAVNAVRRGYEEALVDPESAVGALVDAVPGLDRAATQDAFDAVSPAFLEGVTRFGDLDAARLRTWARWEARERIVRRAPDVTLAFALGF